MSFSIRVKSGLAQVFEYSGRTQREISTRSKREYPILMYHRILPGGEAGERTQAGMHVSPSTFEMHIGYLKRFFRIAPLSEIPTLRNGSAAGAGEKPVCILTFDDGWVDFFVYAYPILRAHAVPATVFLPTKYIGTGNRFWTDTLVDLLVRKEGRKIRASIPRNPVVGRIMGLKGPPESILEEAIALLKGFREDDIAEALEELRETWGVPSGEKDRVFLSWDEVRQMRDSGLITFGSHTENHRILVHLENDEISEELSVSKHVLIRERAVPPSFVPFSYPNGNFDERVVRLVEEAGYHIAVTTSAGWNGADTPIYRLQRIAIHEDMSSTKAMFGCRIANLI